MVKAGKPPDAIRAAMVAKIYALGPSKVSKHLADPNELNVVDIAPGTVSNKPAFEQAVNAEPRVAKFLTPSNQDLAYHLEIPQPQP